MINAIKTEKIVSMRFRHMSK